MYHNTLRGVLTWDFIKTAVAIGLRMNKWKYIQLNIENDTHQAPDIYFEFHFTKELWNSGYSLYLLL